MKHYQMYRKYLCCGNMSPGGEGDLVGLGVSQAASDPSCHWAPSSWCWFLLPAFYGMAASRTNPSGLVLALLEPGRAQTSKCGSCWWGELASTAVQPFSPAHCHPRR